VIGLFGGAFDPPHRGHVELVRVAKEELGLVHVVVLVVAVPGHKEVVTPADVRLRLAQAAFPDDEVILDDHPRTIDLLLDHDEWRDAIFLLGADEFSDFLSWKQPDDVLALVRLGVATRPGFPREALERILEQLAQPQRVLFFNLPPIATASRDLRELLEEGRDVSEELPSAVGEIIRSEGLYRP
jgi:nicotinate-nucleotide adenylyltransferase